MVRFLPCTGCVLDLVKAVGMIKRRLMIVCFLLFALSISTPIGGVQAMDTSGGICEGVSTLPLSECEALVALFVYSGGSTWTNADNWFIDPNPCTWHGVVCADGHVTEIYLTGNGLTGTLPAEIGNFGELAFLDLSNNSIGGDVPASLSKISRLEELYLGHTEIHGDLTNLAKTLERLIVLDIQESQLCISTDALAWTALAEAADEDNAMLVSQPACEVDLRLRSNPPQKLDGTMRVMFPLIFEGKAGPPREPQQSNYAFHVRLPLVIQAK